MKTALDYPRGIEWGHVVKCYASGAGNMDKIFLFPYKGALTEQKITLMAAELMAFYPVSLTQCEHVIRNIAERCGWLRIERQCGVSGTVTLRGDGWMNMRNPEAIIILETVMP